MSDELLEPTDATFDELASKKASGPSKTVLAVMAIAGAGAGGWFGGPIVTPFVAEALASSGEGGGGGHGSPAESSDGPVLIEGLVLNPSGSGGSRFLVASLALDADPTASEELAGRDAEARDLLLTILSSKTIEELSDVSRRDEVREDLKVALNAMLGYEGVHRIFLPQFVIQ